MNTRSWLFGFLSGVILIGVIALLFIDRETRHEAAGIDAVRAACNVEVAAARGAAQAEAKASGEAAGYARALADREEILTEAKATHGSETTPAEAPKCNPFLPPYFPCCGTNPAINEEAWPTPAEFRQGSMLTLSCARTAHRSPTEGAPWVCARTDRHCERSSTLRSGACETCYVYLAGGAAEKKPYAWTGHHLDEMDGPWTADGARGVFP